MERSISLFGLKNELLSETEKGILAVACAIPSKIPSEKQSAVIMKIEKVMEEEGFFTK